MPNVVLTTKQCLETLAKAPALSCVWHVGKKFSLQRKGLIWVPGCAAGRPILCVASG